MATQDRYPRDMIGYAASETFLSEIVGAQAFPARHVSMESLCRYGSRGESTLRGTGSRRTLSRRHDTRGP